MASLAPHLSLLDTFLPGFARPILMLFTGEFPAWKLLPPIIITALIFQSFKPAAIFLASCVRSYWPQPTICMIPTSDPLFDIVLSWAAQQPWSKWCKSSLASCDPAARTGLILSGPIRLRSKAYGTPLSFSPFDVSIPFWWRGRLFLYERQGQHLRTSDPTMLVIRCLGSVQNIHDLLEECRYQYEATQENCSIYHHEKSTWQRVSNVKPRTLSTIILPKNVRKQLVDELREHFSPENREWFRERGQPLRKGYLLHGPPGTGKSSLPQALANEFQLRLYVVNLLATTDEVLPGLFRSLPERCIVLMEDIDDWQTQSSSADVAGRFERCVSMSTLLNVIDGASAREGRVLIMTTNRRDQLDERLTREGRIDREIYLGELDQDMARELFLLIFNTNLISGEKVNEQLAAQAVRFGTKVPLKTYTAAQIIKFLMPHKQSADEALSKFDVWKANEGSIYE
ncbi:P-loop containing nucleoside triphosphate hydrolase protein [Xylariaceae sp. FL1651]|nr:P-loop containing nucleoside triphosphate hydrolase protein [Xylariaceae sp. FL1651]